MDRLLRLVEEHGLRVIERPGPSCGGFEPTTSTIRLAPGMSARTACSVLAHELAHAVLGHAPTADPVLRARQEHRADEWAARQLITPGAYAQAERVRGPHLASLAFELGVTVEIVSAYQRMLVRAHPLGAD
ncbi:ImmA/IrrE family metallo-endopeptidase [Microbacterium sp. H83]|uniref:ImmA/IrrE family metallo-endopeptidase n=1 Tax=Microbacterium sp. H83 TaxID=1827324 RepID=UPI0007F3E7F4|nr:ImmA/IrrE family metallo-endopeptidase [Microbacterium sp. H83]OAN40777.1 hypothetical protein A4X16_12680 [Microbacterium sp. H83]